jgi:diguanylate cyclase (GGDEF)-like protein
VAVALAQQLPLWPHLRRGFGFYGLSSMILFSLVPIVVIIASERAAFMPLLLAPILAVYRTAQIATEKEHQAQYDSLTDLPNRVLLYERVAQSITERPNVPFAVFLIDLDHFKEVNDTLGHQVGDQLLATIGKRLAANVAPTDTVARLGGDEFAVVVTIDGGTEQERTRSARAAGAVVAAAFGESFRVDELTFEIEASIGTALFPDHGHEVDELLRRADVAMYQAKDLGSGVEVYHMARDSHDSRRLALLGELRHAIDSGEIVCHYQPKVDLQTGRVVGGEALVRWDHPEHGHLKPDQFISLAEPTGLISPLTLYVLDTALRQQRRWSHQGLQLSVAVNVSVRTLYDDQFPRDVQELLDRHAAPPGKLVLEVTESTMMSDPGRAAAVLARLSHLGVQISVDDFGTGYSSLAYLKRLPISEVKIDKSFVIGMEDDPEQLAIVSSIVDLGRNLGLRVVAEGVETDSAWALLRDRGCHRAQGYFLSPPLPADGFVAWIREYEETREALAAQEPPQSRAAAIEVVRIEDALRAQVGVDPLT